MTSEGVSCVGFRFREECVNGEVSSTPGRLSGGVRGGGTTRGDSARLVILALISVVFMTGCLVGNPKPKDRFNYGMVPVTSPTSTFAYGPDARHQADVYTPILWRPSDRRPVIVMVHGGGWGSGTRRDVMPSVLAQLRRGWVVVSIDYRLAPAVRFPLPIQDVDRAVRWVKSQAGALGIDPNKLVLAGHSAGGYLATMVTASNMAAPFVAPDLPPDLAAISSRPAGVVSLAGVYDPLAFSDDPYRFGPFALNNFFGCDNSDITRMTCSRDVLVGASLVWTLDRNDPPMYVAHGHQDDVVNLEQVYLLSDWAWRQQMDAKVWIDIVDTGPLEARFHQPDMGVNRASMELFLDSVANGLLV